MLIRLSDSARLFHADCRDAIRELPDNSIDSVVTDPPYALVSIVKRFGGANAAPAKGNDAYMRASAGFMGKTWDTGEVAFSEEFWREVLRVLKPGGHVAAFGASRGYHRMACAIEDAGFEIRDSLMWVYGTGFPKSHDVAKGVDKMLGVAGSKGAVTGKSGSVRNSMAGDFAGGEYHEYVPGSALATQWEGWGTALKPAFEPIVLARKPLSEGTVAANVLRWGTGALNIDGCRIDAGGEDQRRPSSGGDNGLVGTSTFKIRARSIDEQKVQGRWPANVVHSGEAEVTRAFPNEAHRFFFSTAESDTQWLARNLPRNHASNAENCFSLSSELAVSVLRNAADLSTLELVPKNTASPAPSMNVTPSELRRISDHLITMIQSIERRCSPESLPEKRSLSDNLVCIAATREQIDTITITISPSKSNGSVEPVTFNITLPNSDRGAKGCAPSSARFHYSAKASKADRNGSKHPTVKPIALMEWLATLITPPGGTILDPFAGSGTTGAAARNKGFNVVLCEREDEYVADIKRRLCAPGSDTLARLLQWNAAVLKYQARQAA